LKANCGGYARSASWQPSRKGIGTLLIDDGQAREVKEHFYITDKEGDT